MAGEPFDSLLLAETGARLWLCPCPGLVRSLEADLRALESVGTAGVATLVERREMRRLGITDLPRLARAAGMDWWHLPIRNMAAPDDAFEAPWQDAGREIHALLEQGRSVALHCHGGLGRTGTVAARLLIEMGVAPVEAMERVRRARPGSIETRAQELYLRALGGT